ncbi:MAG: hypothetical protein LUD03_03360 [Firmicutes bacterium]|nr:hypothetical protein [Bacillota bacterium]
MKHFNLKMALIAVFILINIAVCCGMVLYSPAEVSTDYSGIIELLKKRGITVEEDAFDEVSSSVIEDAVLENALSDREKLARAILGSSANALPSASNIFMLNNQNVVFSGSSFHFENTEKREEYYYRGSSADNAEAVVGQIAQKLGIDTADSLIASSEDDGSVSYRVTKMIDGKPVYNDYLTIVIADDYLQSLDGIWFTHKDETGGGASVNVNNALIEFMNMPDIEPNAVITSVNVGYRLLDDTNQSTQAQPVCRIVLESGAVYYIDL